MNFAHYIPAYKQSLQISGILCPHLLFAFEPKYHSGHTFLNESLVLRICSKIKALLSLAIISFLIQSYFVSDMFVLVVIIDDIVGTLKG